jgi:quercetin dioxygenase-like cupin family protein
MTAGELENPVTKERITIRHHGPEALLLEVRVPPGMIRPPLHLHRGQQESFEVLQGRVTVRTGREQVPLGPGGRLAVLPGTPHTWWNSGDDEAAILVDLHPPAQMQSFFETFCGMAAEGHCNASGGPPLLQVAVSARSWDMYLAGPPVILQRALFAALGPIARLRGYRASYERFSAS